MSSSGLVNITFDVHVTSSSATLALASIYVNDQKLELHFVWTKSLEYSTDSLRSEVKEGFFL